MHVLVIPSWYPSRSKPVNGMFFREQTVAWQKDSRSGGRVGIIYPRFLSWLEVFEPNWPSLGLDNFSDFGVDTFIHNKINWAPGWRARQRTRWTSAGIKLFERYTDQNGMPDLIHAHSILNGGYLAEQIAKRTGIPFVVTEHKTGFLKQDFFPPKILALIEKVAKKASARLAVSQGLGGQLERLLPAAGPWITVPNSVNSIFFEQALGSNPPTGGRGGGV